jgi:hypothetical protein
VLARSLTVAVSIVMTLQVVTAEGSITISAQSLYTHSITNFEAEQSVDAAIEFGTLTTKGTVATTTLEVTGSFFRSGDFAGSVTVGGFTAQLRVLNGVAYAREGAKFLEHDAKLSNAESTKVSKEWLRAPNSTSDLTKGTHAPEIGLDVTFDSILKEFEQNFGALRLGGTSVINAVPSYVIRGVPGFAMWVTRSTPYLPVDLALSSGGKFGNTDLLNWNVGQPPDAPSPSVPITSIHWPVAEINLGTLVKP